MSSVLGLGTQSHEPSLCVTSGSMLTARGLTFSFCTMGDLSLQWRISARGGLNIWSWEPKENYSAWDNKGHLKTCIWVVNFDMGMWGS